MAMPIGNVFYLLCAKMGHEWHIARAHGHWIEIADTSMRCVCLSINTYSTHADRQTGIVAPIAFWPESVYVCHRIAHWAANSVLRKTLEYSLCPFIDHVRIGDPFPFNSASMHKCVRNHRAFCDCDAIVPFSSRLSNLTSYDPNAKISVKNLAHNEMVRD